MRGLTLSLGRVGRVRVFGLSGLRIYCFEVCPRAPYSSFLGLTWYCKGLQYNPTKDCIRGPGP